jgi:prepilin-type N-terminal cleavage/methylation domain-containing protein
MFSFVRRRLASQERGFTLIELLIVVAIIAILAAIAIPNFLEAQTRSKVSRCRSDLRTFGVAIESYAVDNNRPPLDSTDFVYNHLADHRTFQKTLEGSNGYFTGVVGSLNPESAGFWCYLTTPIAYLNGYLYDPFADTTDPWFIKIYVYMAFKYRGGTLPDGSPVLNPDKAFDQYRMAGHIKGFTWGVQAFGPKSGTSVEAPFINNVLGGNGAQIAGHAGFGDATGSPSYYATGTASNDALPGSLGQIYDPTNGTVSRGRIYNSNKGIVDGGLVATLW